MVKDIGLGDLDYMTSGGPNEEECSKLDGFRVKIVDVKIIDDVSRYDNLGNELPEGQEVPVKKIQLTTDEFGQELIGRKIFHIQSYSLKEKDGKWIVSLHEKSNTGQFLSKYKLDRFENAVGKEVVLVKKTNPNTKKSRLVISI